MCPQSSGRSHRSGGKVTNKHSLIGIKRREVKEGKRKTGRKERGIRKPLLPPNKGKEEEKVFDLTEILLSLINLL